MYFQPRTSVISGIRVKLKSSKFCILTLSKLVVVKTVLNADIIPTQGKLKCLCQWKVPSWDMNIKGLPVA
jgi:hypothetical protein